eukprot:s611_g16.t1
MRHGDYACLNKFSDGARSPAPTSNMLPLRSSTGQATTGRVPGDVEQSAPTGTHGNWSMKLTCGVLWVESIPAASVKSGMLDLWASDSGKQPLLRVQKVRSCLLYTSQRAFPGLSALQSARMSYLANSLFVRNLSPQVTETVIREVFSSCDEIVKVSFKPYPNNETQFFAQVDFKTSMGVSEGSKLTGTKILGCACSCSVIDPIRQADQARQALAAGDVQPESKLSGQSSTAPQSLVRAVLWLSAASSRVHVGNIDRTVKASAAIMRQDLINPEWTIDVYRTLPKVSHVDVFVSHSWSSSPFLKTLALCLFMNMWMAVKAAVATWIGLSFALVVSMGGPYSLGGTDMLWLTAVLVYLPVAVFVTVLLFGQTITCGRPLFVASSSRMLVLGDDTYFERLWCNLELAIFAKCSSDPGAVQYMPLWLAPWILSTIFMDIICITIAPPLESFALDHLSTRIQESFGEDSTMKFFLVLMLTWIFPGMCYLPAALPSFFSHVRSARLQGVRFWCGAFLKIRQHELTLQHMDCFNIQNAKCTCEPDREIIENQVLELFDDPVEDSPGKGPLSPVDNRSPWRRPSVNSSWNDRERRKRFRNFNRYVHGPLRESVLRGLGKEPLVYCSCGVRAEVDMPWSLCLICFMPLVFYSAVSVLGCDGNRCDVTAQVVGYDTALQYVVANALSWILGFGMVIPTTHPILLRMVKVVLTVSKNVPTQVCLTAVCTVGAYAWVFT